MKTLILGVGNDYRSDDAVGLIVAQCVREKGLDQVIVHEAGGEGAALMEAWKGARTVILIDAVCSGAEAGTIHRIEAHRRPLPAGFFRLSTHAFSVADAIEMARALNRLPSRLTVYGIEGRNFEAETGLSPAVSQAVQRVVERVLEEVAPK